MSQRTRSDANTTAAGSDLRAACEPDGDCPIGKADSVESQDSLFMLFLKKYGKEKK